MQTQKEERPSLYCCSIPLTIAMEDHSYRYASEMLSDDMAERIETSVRLFARDYAVETGLVAEGYPESDGLSLLALLKDNKAFYRKLTNITDVVSYTRDRDLSDMCRRIIREDVTAFADTKSYVAMKCDELEQMLEILRQAYMQS